MKKVWVWILSGLAFVVSGFAWVRCVHNEPPCYYGGPIPEPTEDTVAVNNASNKKKELQQRLDSIRAILEEREFAEVYGPPEIIEEYRRETTRLRNVADSISKELEDLDHEQ